LTRPRLAAVFSQIRRSLRYRLVLLTTLIIVIGTGVAGVATHAAARVSLYDQLDAELVSIANNITDQLSEGFSQTAMSTESFNAENVQVVLVGANTNVRSYVGDPQNSLITDYHEVAIARTQTGISTRDGRSADGTAYRIVAVPFTDSFSGDAYAVSIGRELGPTNEGLLSLNTLQWLISLLTIAVCFGVVIVVSGAILRPIHTLTTEVSNMTSTDQLHPITVHDASEVAELEQSFNALIESLALSQSQQNRLIADAGHELRTPLTSLRTNIELLVADDSSHMLPEGARSQILSDVAAQLGEFTSLINDLMALSRSDAAPPNMAALDLANVVTRAITRAKRRGSGLIFDVDLTTVYVMGDAVMLERAITNLLDNAVKFSPPGGTITVVLNPSDGLVIADQGPGIADEDVPHIFERFYRSDSSRNTPGTGLGLSIVDHTINAHGGDVEVGRASGGGAVFTVYLPEIDAIAIDD
jgi:two-component system sensor histidine kinase MprB